MRKELHLAESRTVRQQEEKLMVSMILVQENEPKNRYRPSGWF
ncbi:hypothetical protein [Leptospira perolatii]|nr:hypothetical protein [Leptospira perolatii]